jgi:hypothetical protein
VWAFAEYALVDPTCGENCIVIVGMRTPSLFIFSADAIPTKSAFLVTGNGTRVTGAHIQLYQDIARNGADVGDGFFNDSAPDAYPKQFRLTDENPKKHDVGFAGLALDPNGPSLHAIDDNYFPEYCLKPILEMARHEPPSVDRPRPIVYTWYLVLGRR